MTKNRESTALVYNDISSLSVFISLLSFQMYSIVTINFKLATNLPLLSSPSPIPPDSPLSPLPPSSDDGADLSQFSPLLHEDFPAFGEGFPNPPTEFVGGGRPRRRRRSIGRRRVLSDRRRRSANRRRVLSDRRARSASRARSTSRRRRSANRRRVLSDRRRRSANRR